MTNYKPDPEGIFKAMEIFAIDKSSGKKCIMIGDATTDIQMGKSAGISTCAVTWGAHSREKLSESRPDYIADTVQALGKILEKTT